MKKFVVFVFLFVGIFLAGTAFATEWYTVDVIGGSVNAQRGASAAVTLPGTVPTTPVLPLDVNYAPFVTGPSIDPLVASMPAGNWNAAGWWEFQVNNSSGSGWNNVFGGGNYTFTSDWWGLFNVHFADINMTFADVYGKWSKNNDSVWTYFGLYVNPNTGAASTPGVPTGPPIGIFAFVADDPLLYPPPGFPSLELLYGAVDQNQGPITISGGTGRFEAVPEPATMLLLGLGLMGVAGIRRKFKS